VDIVTTHNNCNAVRAALLAYFSLNEVICRVIAWTFSNFYIARQNC